MGINIFFLLSAQKSPLNGEPKKSHKTFFFVSNVYIYVVKFKLCKGVSLFVGKNYLFFGERALARPRIFVCPWKTLGFTNRNNFKKYRSNNIKNPVFCAHECVPNVLRASFCCLLNARQFCVSTYSRVCLQCVSWFSFGKVYKKRIFF